MKAVGMNNFSIRDKKHGTGISLTILSVIAFTCTILSVAIQFPDHWHPLEALIIIAQVAPCILVFYAVVCLGKIKKEILLPIIFSLFATYPILLIIIYGYNRHPNTGNIIYIVEAICHLLATISIARKSKKIFPILAICVSALVELVYLFNLFSLYIDLPAEVAAATSFIFPNFLNCVGRLAVYSVSISLLFTNIPAPPKNAYQSTAQQELCALRDKFNHGAISEEEYKEQRSKIINNL